jgi:ATP synthase protein I
VLGTFLPIDPYFKHFPAGKASLMKKETRGYLKDLAYFSSIGFSVAIAIFLGLAVGLYLDRRFGSSPWFTLIFLGLGIAAGFRNIGIAIRKSRDL